MKNLWGYILLAAFLCGCANQNQNIKKTNVLFIMMDDLGYGQFGIYNDTISTSDFDPYFVSLVDSLQGYSLEKSLEFSKIAIPNLTTLAKEGIIFNKAFTSSNICAPSRMGIATGMIQNKFGVYTNTDCEKQGLETGTHLAEILKKQNYKTAHIGKWHIGKRDKQIINNILSEANIDEQTSYNNLKKSHPEVFKKITKTGYIGSVVNEQHPLNNGFDYYYGYNHWSSDFYNAKNVWEDFKYTGNQPNYNTDVFTTKAINAMKGAIKNKDPFYVQLHYHAVHDSLEPKAPEKYFKKFNADSYDLNNFYAHINAVDENVQRIMDYLKSEGQYENTIVIFTSDNGAMAGGSYDGHKTGSPLPGNTPFSGHKGNFYQGGFRVPMFVSWPGHINQPRVSDLLVSTMDILPTAIDASGCQLPKQIDGKSLLPILENKPKQKGHDYLIWSGIQSYKWGYLINKSTKTHSNESGFAPPAWVVIKDDYLLRFTGTLEKGIYKDHMEGRTPIIELFNIKNDPAENNNLVKKYPEKVKELSQLYFNESENFPPPADWKKSKWEELRSKDLFQ
ncbi:MAG: sulfatase-like hydrolase/transferase [Algibacter sp.]|uniref:sulfatase family protein n=1 Tax=Algibacter sp. TaxID=1872428 RepID=UPI002618E17D|nr:sulfatase-like hydrolase/transferase [Algibacter sp.]MDG1729109.1 sulfatase-like hydrolase/transferase [Algibacter sp.]MDG2179685.1 sulfatase-like hydrolase/transferase [Algibacter sp.]